MTTRMILMMQMLYRRRGKLVQSPLPHGKTHQKPMANMTVTAILFGSGICSLQTIGIGKHSTITSVTMLKDPFRMYDRI